MLKPAAAAAGVPWASWHTLRHTCGSVLFRHGANAKQFQAWLGHHSPAFTVAVYVHLLDDDAPDASFFDAITSPSEVTRVATFVATRPDLAPRFSLLATQKSDLAGNLRDGPSRARTCDLGIKSPLLYQLSYRPRFASVGRSGTLHAHG